jgi:hypothetical protein
MCHAKKAPAEGFPPSLKKHDSIGKKSPAGALKIRRTA